MEKYRNSMLVIIILLASISFLLAGVFEKGFGSSCVNITRDSNSSSDTKIYSPVYGARAANNNVDYLYDADPFAETSPFHDEFYGVANHIVLMSKKADVNGDGIDDIIHLIANGPDSGTFDVYGTTATYDGVGDNPYVFIFDGSDGKPLTFFDGEGVPNGIYMIDTADIDADGKDEVVLVEHYGSDATTTINGKVDGFSHGSRVRAVDFDYDNYGVLQYSYKWSYVTANKTGTGTYTAVEILRFGNFNTTAGLDVVVSQKDGYYSTYTPAIRNSATVALNGITGSQLWYKTNGSSAAGFGTCLMEVANMNQYGLDDVVRVRYYNVLNSVDHLGNRSYVDVIDGSNPSSLICSWADDDLSVVTTLDGSRIYQMKVGNIDNDNYPSNPPEFIYTRRHGDDSNGDGIGESSLLIVRDDYINGCIRKAYTHCKSGANDIHWAGFDCYILELANADASSDGINEIIHIRHSSTGAIHSSQIVYKVGTSSLTACSWYDPTAFIKFVAYANIDGSGVPELVTAEKASDSLRVIIQQVTWNGNTASMSAYASKAYGTQGWACRSMVILNNEITDEELNYSIGKSASTSCFSYIDTALDGLVSVGVDGAHYTSFDNALSNSTIYGPSGMDTWGYINYVEINKRLGLIIHTLNEDLSSFDENQLKLALKSIITHVRWLSSKNHFINFAHNYGMLFELPYYIDGVGSLVEAPEFDVFESIFANRYCNMLDIQIYNDGVYNESTMNYSFWFNKVACNERFDRVPNSTYGTNARFPNAVSRMDDMDEKLAKMYEYYLYEVNPVIVPADTNVTVTDLPMKGDTFSDTNSYFIGKINSSSGAESRSLLYFPIKQSNNITLLDGSAYTSLKNNLGFTAYNTYGSSTYPSFDAAYGTSKAFNNGKVFIGRSNWITNSGGFDPNARYWDFKAGIIENNQCSMGHSHADHLSMEISGYGHNLIIDPSGYESWLYTNPQDLTTQLNSAYHFSQAPITYSNNDRYIEDINRYYFKGNAVHSNVYLPQIPILDPLYDNGTVGSTWDPDEFTGVDIDMSYDINADVDCVIGEVTKPNAIFQRQITHIKPHSASGVNYNQAIHDFWFITDNVTPTEAPSYTPQNLYQNWHISKDQCTTLPPTPTTATVSGLVAKQISFPNMLITSVNTNSNIGASMIASKSTLEDRNHVSALLDTRIAAFSIPFVNADSTMSINTAIQPFANSSAPTSVSFAPLHPRTTNPGSTVPSNQAVAYTMTYAIGTMTYVDKFLISYTQGTSYYWDAVAVAESYRVHFKRYAGPTGGKSTLVYEITIPWDAKEGNSEIDGNIPCVPSLSANYPNPFNPETTISFSIPKESKVELEIYNVKGQKVKTLTNKKYDKGQHSLVWNGSNDIGRSTGSGVYFYTMKVNGKHIQTRKCVLMK